MNERTAEETEAAEERGGDPDERSPTEHEEGGARAPDETDGGGADDGDAGAGDDVDADATNDADSDVDTGAEAGTDDGEDAGSGQEGEDSSLPTRVAEYDEALADQVAAELESGERTAADLRDDLDTRAQRIEELEARVDGLEAKLKRKQADVQNFKKRQEKKLEDQRERAKQNLLERLLPVRDNLVRALDQDEGTDIREGVEGTLREFDRVLDDESVTAIDPDPGAETDPNRHEVMMRVESGQPEGTVVDVYRTGYEMDDRVVRTAQVTVSDGSAEG